MKSSIPVLDSRFLIKSLGGEEEVINLFKSIGMDPAAILSPSQDICRESKTVSYCCDAYIVTFYNYVHKQYYPDIKIIFPGNGGHYKTMCEDIGLDETWDESMIRVKKWFYDVVIPISLEELFS